ncbi:hypothetical protein GUJ93_ZPchr0006g44871 [Zizania palustris]|uniref:Uncharacterized protein n=1 Tax=Zizania palustris TaxID=103762 RepID=A0A8J5SMA3_ZIZPA|nr:hypothetical protein GUJ93_ZPchr0006g44871 [Zizania palustris]
MVIPILSYFHSCVCERRAAGREEEAVQWGLLLLRQCSASSAPASCSALCLVSLCFEGSLTSSHKSQLGAPKCYWSAALSVREGEGEEKMAGTVVSMALSLLGSAISKASSAAAEEMSLIMNVRTEICS